jgi:predicted membrane GTPase involved in stress response
MVDGCVLLVDVTEGPMPQTKFVLSKALAMGLHPLVVFNKVDRPTVSATQCDLVHGHLFDLFSSLGATESQLDFPVLFASGVLLATHVSCQRQSIRAKKGVFSAATVVWALQFGILLSSIADPSSAITRL